MHVHDDDPDPCLYVHVCIIYIPTYMIVPTYTCICLLKVVLTSIQVLRGQVNS